MTCFIPLSRIAFRLIQHLGFDLSFRWTPRLNEFKGILVASVFYQGAPQMEMAYQAEAITTAKSLTVEVMTPMPGMLGTIL